MDRQSFEEQDKSWMDATKKEREKKVPSAIMKGFSASIESKIRQNQPSLEIKFKSKRVWVPVWAPVFAVLVIGSVLVLRSPAGTSRGVLQYAPDKTVQLAQANVTQLSDEIAALREIGAWTDEDEKSIGVITDAELEDLELANARSDSKIRLA